MLEGGHVEDMAYAFLDGAGERGLAAFIVCTPALLASAHRGELVTCVYACMCVCVYR